jgi:ABC-type amino acid transport substrate-binding protein
VLYYHSTKGRATTSVVEGLFYPQYYGFAFQRGSDLRKKFNLALLKAREDGTYSTIYNKWFK